MFKKYFSISLISISLIIFFYTFYRSELFFEGQFREKYQIYYFISLILLIFSFLTFFLSKRTNILISIFLLSTLFSFYTFEVYKSLSIKKTSSEKRLIFFKEKLKRNKEIKIIIAPENFIKKKNKFIPLGGISNVETIYCNENGYFSIYESDRYGFNNPDNEHNSSDIEYFLVGDSFTHGACVNRPNDITSVLRKKSNKNALNFGYGSHGPLEELGVIKEYLNENVKKIIWIYYEGNDLINLQNSYKNKILRNYLELNNFSQNLINRQEEINYIANDLINDYLNNKQTKTKFIKILKLTKFRSIIIDKLKKEENITLNEENLEIFKHVIEKAALISRENGSEFYFVYLPSFQRYVNKNYVNEYEKIINIIETLDVNLINIHEKVFKKTESPLEFFALDRYSHYSVKGYKEIANEIFEETK